MRTGVPMQRERDRRRVSVSPDLLRRLRERSLEKAVEDAARVVSEPREDDPPLEP